MQISQHLISATQQLSGLSDSPRLDAEVLLAFSLQQSRTWLATWSDKTLTTAQLESFQHLLQRRANGEPVAHITGTREFWSLPLNVTPHTLIPRPDTELLVEQVLNTYDKNSNITLADLGTGSGAIALALASARPDWKIVASDKSTAALEIASLNAKQLGLQSIEFLSGSWFEPLDGLVFDVIVSNPPYIKTDDPHLLQGDVRFEPLYALTSGTDGLTDLRQIITQAKHKLSPGGRLFVEHGYDQQPDVLDLFISNGYIEVNQHQDLANNYRLSTGKKP